MKRSVPSFLLLFLAAHAPVFSADAPPAPAAALAEAEKLLGGIKPPPPAKVPQVEYYVSVDDKPTGPFPCAKVLEMAKARVVSPETKIWKAGLESWQRAASFEELRPIFAVVPPPVDGDLPKFVDVRSGDVPTPCPPPDDGKGPWWWPLPWWPFKVK